MTILPPRPPAEVVEAALQRCSWHNQTSRENILAAELLHLRETVERCREVMRINAKEAEEWEAALPYARAHAQHDTAKTLDLERAECHAVIYREVASELAEALR